MIKTVKELQEYVLQGLHPDDDIIFQRPCMMTSPGCPKDRIVDLKTALPGIPESYVKWVEALNLNGISIGYFEVSPCSFNSEDMVANLIQGNQDGVMFSEQMQQYHLYSIATVDGYGVFTATASSSFKEGEIIIIDEDTYTKKDTTEQYIHQFAKDFEQFLVVAGNFNQIHQEIRKDKANWEQKKIEFFERLKALSMSEEYHSAWLSMF